MMRNFYLQWLIFLSAIPVNAFSQTYFFDNYNSQHEFESKVYCIVQDRERYVWLGTPTGLWKFDGRTFINYSIEDGLAEGSVRTLFRDPHDVLWLGHEGGGISRKKAGKFERIALLDSVLHSNITSIICDADKRLWITTENDGALMISNPNARIEELKYIHYLQGKSLGDQVFSTLLTKNGTLFFITNAGIKKYNKATDSFEKYLPKGLSTYFSISAMFEDSRSNLWFGTYNGGLSCMDARDKSFKYYDTRDGLASNWITSITEDRLGNIWIGHWKNEVNTGGITRIDSKGIIHVYNTSNGLHDDRIWCITPDFEGNILIGTTEQGLEIFKGETFLSISTHNGLIHNQVNAINRLPNGEIWFGTNKGISVLNESKEGPSYVQYNQSNSHISDQIRFFRTDKNNNLWIGTGDEGILMYNTHNRRFVSQPQINSYLPYYQTLSKGISAMEIDNRNHLWIGTIAGLVEFDIENNQLLKTYTQGSGLSGNEITTLYTDSENNMWIGARNKGITKMSNGNFLIYKELSDVSPSCITRDKEGKLWIGTDSKGLFVLENDSIYAYTGNLLSRHINLLFCDKDNHIYVGTNLGLNVIDQKKERCLSYTRRTGFTGIETKQNAFFPDDKGYLWVGTANGAIRCNLSLLSNQKPEKPQIHIAEVQIKGETTNQSARRRLSNHQNDLTFRYNCISLVNPEGVIYSTILEGYDEDWQNMHNENSRSFMKLPAGKYVFKVKALDPYGEWTPVPAEYSFRILEPPYRRGYFILSIIGLIFGSIIGYIKLRERNLVHEKKVLEVRVSERTRELQVANTELSMKNKDILDSITYARRIQMAILPAEILFKDTFILYKPKDIVSGDFYWMNTVAGKEFIAAVDCTGHGVPGAFMSFIGYTSLNKIIIEQGINKPSEILNRLNHEVAATLHQKGESIVNDGMDIALITFSPVSGKVEYAGAFNPLIIVRKNEIIEIRADRFAIGRSTGSEKEFTNNEIMLEKGDALYLFSDGYADQFGGPDGKKFKMAALKNLFIEISNLSVEDQLIVLESRFDSWKDNQEQIDDVMIIGRKF